MRQKILKSPVSWSIILIFSQALITKLSDNDMVTLVASFVLIIAALFIWKLEKYQSEMSLNRYSIAFAVCTVGVLLLNLWFYVSVITEFKNSLGGIWP